MRIAVSKRRVAVMSLAKAVGAMLLAGLALTPAAQAQTLASLPTVPSAIEAAGDARPITAWVDFCQSYQAECAVDRREPTMITLNAANWGAIVSANRRVNKSIRAITDVEHLHVADRWDLAEDGSGDCEDFQLLKRKLLVEAGLPRRAMRMTVVIDEKGEGHAVLTLITDRGDLILDNKTNNVLPWRQTGYTFIKRESQNAVAWVSLGRATSPVTTANR
ncbi:transglutaminase-like cysteine peptidase [Methylobacterium iners]|uniref:Transglutaminase n=1 Tax=Methylobacterium iners TaxID=418707 RepID=A0ABQ4RUL4_9HYPH|nr:transglutaminase-like cysteine peptidase [Methylobacterium iners]GJD93662.1 hypothetical protein OCOJLMKI_0858 [Methylobacterium iners]